jgi:hypothetical protein
MRDIIYEVSLGCAKEKLRKSSQSLLERAAVKLQQSCKA